MAITDNESGPHQRLRAYLANNPHISLRTLSRKLGRNDAYLHQFLNRGSPRILPEQLRLSLSAMLGIPEHELREQDDQRTCKDDNLKIPFLETRPAMHTHKGTDSFDEQKEKEVTYQLVGNLEADLAKSQISLSSPMGKALIAKQSGDEVIVKAPAGDQVYEVLSVRYQ